MSRRVLLHNEKMHVIRICDGCGVEDVRPQSAIGPQGWLWMWRSNGPADGSERMRIIDHCATCRDIVDTAALAVMAGER